MTNAEGEGEGEGKSPNTFKRECLKMRAHLSVRITPDLALGNFVPPRPKEQGRGLDARKKPLIIEWPITSNRILDGFSLRRERGQMMARTESNPTELLRGTLGLDY